MVAKRVSTHRSIISRTSEPLIPQPLTAAPGDEFPVVGIDDEADAHDLTVAAGELEAVGTPAQVRA
jgi:hypothetical protein